MKTKLFDGSIAATAQEAVDFITNILESSTEYSIIGKDLQGTIVLWNEGAHRLYGYSPDEVVGKSNSEMLHTREDIASGKPRRMMEEALRDGKWEGTMVRVRKDGDCFTARVVITPRRDSTGRPIGFLLISKDITEEIRLEQGLKTSKLFDNTAFRSAQEAVDFITNILESSTEYSIIGKDLQGTIVLWNEGARRLYGYSPDEVVGKANSEILHTREDITSGKPRKMMEEALRDGKWEGTMVRVRRDGGRFTARVVVTLRRDYTGRPLGFVLISKDISDEIRFAEEREKAEEKLRQAYDELEERVRERTADLVLTNRHLQEEIEQRKRAEKGLQEKNIELENAKQSKDRFLASMSHELRTALHAMVGFTDVAETKTDGSAPEGAEKETGIPGRDGRYLPSLVNDLLDLAKIESGMVEISIATVDVADAIRDVMGALRPVAEQKRLKFTEDLPHRPVTARTDRRALCQILTTLTGRAIDLSEGRVHLELAQPLRNGRVVTEINVMGTGLGIHEGDQTKIVEAFRQLDSYSTSLYPPEGTGIGLHLSQKLAELIGGEIRFSSAYHQGCTFTLTLK